MPLINCKVFFELNWIEDCILFCAGNSAKFAITHANLHVPIVTLSTKDSANLAKQLNEEFKRSVYWNRYETKPEKVIEQRKTILFLHILLQRMEMMKADIKNNKKYLLPIGEIKNQSVLIDERNFYDQSINDIIKQYDEVRKVSTGYGDDYTTGCLLDYAYFKDNHKLIAVDVSKQKAL